MMVAKTHLPFLDGLRGLAAFAVFLFHAYATAFNIDHLPWNGWFRDFRPLQSAPYLVPLTYGWCGVPIFFVVSGFCIHLSHQRDPQAGWAEFWRRRFWRIYPPYLLAVLVFFFVWPWGTVIGIETPERQRQLWSHLLLVHNLDQRTIFGITGPLWSIAVEVQLYLIYPLLLMLIARSGWRQALFLACILEVAGNYSEPCSLKLFGSRSPYVISKSPFSFWASWSLGAYLAQCCLDHKPSVLSRIRFDTVALIALALPLFKPTEPLSFFAFAVAAGVAVDRLVSGAWSPPTGPVGSVCWRHLAFLGTVSYSFYLMHQPFIGLTEKVSSLLIPGLVLSEPGKVLAALAWYPVILLLSSITYVAIEMPAARVGRRANTTRVRHAEALAGSRDHLQSEEP